MLRKIAAAMMKKKNSSKATSESEIWSISEREGTCFHRELSVNKVVLNAADDYADLNERSSISSRESDRFAVAFE